MITARFLMLAIGAEIHVAPTGSDPALGTLDQPLATVTTALAKARPLVGREPVAITLANGVHRLTQPVILGPADSGTGRSPGDSRFAGVCGTPRGRPARTILNAST